MPIHNQEIAEIFEEMANLLEIDNANPFRVRAYRTAALFIGNYSHRLDKMVSNKEDLTQLPGIGDDLAKKITTIVKTGQLPALKQLEKRIPKSVIAMLKLKGLGPKRVKILYKNLHIHNLADLLQAGKNHKIRELPGFSEKSESAIVAELEKNTGAEQRYKYADVQAIAEELIDYLKQHHATEQAVIAGSYRRKKDTIGDIDILVTAKQGARVMDHFVKFSKVATILSKGKTRSTIQLTSGLQVDLRVVPAISYGAALLYFTGSKAHNIALRKIALSRHLKINEYGVFRNEKRIAGKTEQEMYRSIDLPYIEPELREDRGEIRAAQQGQLPTLITLADIRGDLHCHTTATDGRDSIEDMAKAAASLGYVYIAITDHTKHLSVVHGQDSQQVLKQITAIEKCNEKLQKNNYKIRILKSAEVDILEDGRLDLPDKVLKQLDLTVCSIHFKFNLSNRKQTARIIRAMHNPYFTILGHPSGRLLNQREAYDINFERVFTTAKELGRFLEINAQPERLDLNDEYCRLAKDMQIKLVISTDAHSADQLNLMPYGINQARRGWIEAKDVLNTYSLTKLLQHIRNSH